MTDSPNVVIIVLDTMRRDHLGSYGPRARTPHLDLLAADSVVYPNCISSSPWTVPSHASLFTGLLPSRHGVHETRETKITEVFGMMAKAEAETLAEFLARRGYESAGFTANPNLSAGSGFERGFRSMEYRSGPLPGPSTVKALELAKKYGKTRGEVTKKMLSRGKFADLTRLFLEDRKLKRINASRNYPLFKGGDLISSEVGTMKFEEPFFLFVNMLEMHEPYLRGEPGGEPKPIAHMFGKVQIGERLIASIRQKYSEEASAVDSFAGKIIEWLRRTGRYDGSMIIVTADHGQELKEKGYFGHGTFLHDEIVKVPLMVKYPGNRKHQPPTGFQPLQRVQEAVKDSLAGMYDGDGLSSPLAISEGFGVPGLRGVEDATDYEAKRERFDRPRKALFRGDLKLVVDGRNGSIEEFTESGRPVTPEERKQDVREMVAALAELRDPGFVLPG